MLLRTNKNKWEQMSDYINIEIDIQESLSGRCEMDFTCNTHFIYITLKNAW